ncbi:DUF6036 family nucleotidyltransferase [Glutamicibacter sp. AOP12-B1-11]|uniref:DUF6036 family nucleotidyltransferase n=1 Tax=Glutamicibacter sp. AOP12-B1-11 TaxID=3457725 RepID=UPI004033BDD8
MSKDFTVDEIRELLGELGARLCAKGITPTIRLVGGAAVAFMGNDRRVTQDIDASYTPQADVERVIASMAQERNLPSGWLNSSATAFIPAGAKWVSINLGDGLKAYIASPDTLLAMKLSSARDRDMLDISFLLEKLGIQNVDAATEIAAELYGDDDVAYSRTSREDAPIVAEEAINQKRKNEPN